jgi:hypothetical protein
MDQEREKGKNGGAIFKEERDAVWERREKAAELHAIGKTGPEIAAILNVPRWTAWNDVRIYFREAARYYRAPEVREKIAAGYRWMIRQTQEEYEKLGDSTENASLRFEALDRFKEALEGLRGTYGFSGNNTFRLELPGSAAEVATSPEAPQWAEHLPKEQVRQLRAKMVEFRNALPRAAIPEAMLAEEAEVEEIVEPAATEEATGAPEQVKVVGS